MRRNFMTKNPAEFKKDFNLLQFKKKSFYVIKGRLPRLKSDCKVLR